MAAAMYLSAVKAGAECDRHCGFDHVWFSSQPPTEIMVAILEAEGYATGLDPVRSPRSTLTSATSKRCASALRPARWNRWTPTLRHHIPGGMISNSVLATQQQDALDRLPEVPKSCRAPAPTWGIRRSSRRPARSSVQAVLNVLAGKRYEMVTGNARLRQGGSYAARPLRSIPSWPEDSRR